MGDGDDLIGQREIWEMLREMPKKWTQRTLFWIGEKIFFYVHPCMLPNSSLQLMVSPAG
jgi:hypothetical protein